MGKLAAAVQMSPSLDITSEEEERVHNDADRGKSRQRISKTARFDRGSLTRAPATTATSQLRQPLL